MLTLVLKLLLIWSVAVTTMQAPSTEFTEDKLGNGIEISTPVLSHFSYCLRIYGFSAHGLLCRRTSVCMCGMSMRHRPLSSCTTFMVFVSMIWRS